MYERSQSRPPQVRGGPADSSLSGLRFILWLHLDLGSLEGGNLRLELVVVLFQQLLLSGGIIVVKSHLLSVAI